MIELLLPTRAPSAHGVHQDVVHDTRRDLHEQDVETAGAGSFPFRPFSWAEPLAGVARHRAIPRNRLTNKQRFARMTVPLCQKSAMNGT